MYEIFKTVLILSIFGFILTAILMALKPVTAKRFPAKWQYYVWVAVLLLMIAPIYKLIPPKSVQNIPFAPSYETTDNTPQEDSNTETVVIEQTPIEFREVNIFPEQKIRLLDLIAYCWFVDACVFLLIVISSYVIFLIRKHKTAIQISENAVLNAVRNELNIKRKIKLKMSDDVKSPMLVGVILPTVYIPCKEIADDTMRMVLLHELTHYKRKDLLIKWVSIVVNAVHWFNPLCYLLRANINEACEVSCDMSVTKGLSDDEQKLYMRTILDLTEQED